MHFLSPSQSLVAPEDARLQRQSTTQAARTRPSVAWCVSHSQTWHPTIGQGELSQNDCHVGPGSAPFSLVKKKKIGVFVAFKFQQQRGQINVCPRTAHAACPLHQLPRGNHMDKPQLHHTLYYQAELSTQILTRRLENESHFSFSPQKSWEVRWGWGFQFCEMCLWSFLWLR